MNIWLRFVLLSLGNLVCFALIFGGLIYTWQHLGGTDAVLGIIREIGIAWRGQ